ncbi:hypothetical protein HDU88_007744 [Geranomyces variabilis]|nr:hypothetical protein HDU88_007744 [Geranomyces variabilis]
MPGNESTAQQIISVLGLETVARRGPPKAKAMTRPGPIARSFLLNRNTLVSSITS